MKTWRVYSLDVWGNQRDGFEVNDRCNVGTIELPEDATDKQIIRAMVEQGYLRSSRFHFAIDGDDMMMDIDHEPTGRPLYSLERDD